MRPRPILHAVSRTLHGRAPVGTSVQPATTVLAAVVMIALTIGTSTARANGVPLKKGDVLAGIGSAQVKNFTSTGALQDTLMDNSQAGDTTGMCFDSSGNLYVTDFSTTMSKYDEGGNLVASPFGEGFPSGHPESCAVDASNHIFVGGPSSASIEELDTSGKLLATFVVEGAAQTGGTDWVDLAADQCTIYYTGEGPEIKRFNVCTNTQEPNFASGVGCNLAALRIRPSGEVIAACETSNVLRFDSTGKLVETYTVPGAGFLFAMNLDPDGTTFWTGDINSGEIYRVDIATGTVINEFNSSPNTQLAGLAVVGEIRAAVPPKPTTLTTSLSGEGKSGEKIGVKVGASVTDTATLGGANAATATGSVTYKVYSDNKCEKEVAAAGTVAVSGGKVPNSEAKALAPGTYYWQASYGGDEANEASRSECGAEVLTVEGGPPPPPPPATTLSTSLSGEGKSGEKIGVKVGASVTDTATLGGANAATATGSVTYKVYSDNKCEKEVASAGTVAVSGGKVPNSEAKALAPGTYYWQASYGGDEANKASRNECGAEVLTVEKEAVKEEPKATCGNTAVGKESDPLNANQKRVNACLLPGNASVGELSVYLAPTSKSGEQLVRGVIYADSHGAPGALLGTTEQLSFKSTNTAGWYRLAFASPLALSAGRYWIGTITGATAGVAAERYHSVENAEDYNANSYDSRPSDPFGSFKSGDEQMSLYATYTPVGPQTFGKTDVGKVSDWFVADRKRVNNYSLPVEGSVSKLSVYLAPTATAGEQLIEGVIYVDEGGKPQALLGTTEALTFKSSQKAGWYDLPFASSLTLPAGSYWIGVISGGKAKVAGFRYGSVPGARDYNANPFSSGPSSPFGSFKSDDEQMSLFATYTAS
jgi:hypothetical protein